MSQGWLVFWVLTGALVAGAVYLGHCRWRPYANCWRCDGRGKFRSRTGRSWRRCPRCKGGGERIRVGRRIWTKLMKVKKDAIG